MRSDVEDGEQDEGKVFRHEGGCIPLMIYEHGEPAELLSIAG